MTGFYCYILECADGSFYTGWSTDPERRTRLHNSGRGARYTRAHRPVRLVYVENQPDRSSAMKREHIIKNMNRKAKERLICQETNILLQVVSTPDINDWDPGK